MTKEEAVSRIENVEDFVIRLAKDFEKRDYEAFDMAIKALKQPTHKKGKWIKIGDRDFGYADIVICKCSECGNKEEFHGHYNGVSLELRSGYNYCPKCGADMRGEVEE